MSRLRELKGGIWNVGEVKGAIVAIPGELRYRRAIWGFIASMIAVHLAINAAAIGANLHLRHRMEYTMTESDQAGMLLSVALAWGRFVYYYLTAWFIVNALGLITVLMVALRKPSARSVLVLYLSLAAALAGFEVVMHLIAWHYSPVYIMSTNTGQRILYRSESEVTLALMIPAILVVAMCIAARIMRASAAVDVRSPAKRGS